MMVTFISQCEKKALPKTRRVLDAFANRIGDNTWQTIITNEGLQAVKKLLRKTASKNTAVSCHWVRSRSRSEFVWVVGNRDKFNADGFVPVNRTQQNLIYNRWENDWQYQPLISTLAALAALFHDWGKASDFFQKKLTKNEIISDPLRHEWISLLFFNTFVGQSADTEWLGRLSKGDISSKTLKKNVTDKQDNQQHDYPLEALPNAASMVAWLILSHHKLPTTKSYHDTSMPSFQELFRHITQEWGYENRHNKTDYTNDLAKCFSYRKGTPSQSPKWLSYAKTQANNLLEKLPLLEQSIKDGSWRLVLSYARLSLMLADHHYSSLDKDPKWKTTLELYANSSRDSGKPELKQKLDEHLVRVAKQAIRNSRFLPAFENRHDDLKEANDIKALAQKSTDKNFQWQDVAVRRINQWRDAESDKTDARHFGFFAVNMASTGKGKTFANAKIMRALSPQANSLRYVLALGLRTLTLQTGDEYRDRIHLGKEDLAVLIGSRAVTKLHQKNARDKQQAEESDEDLMPGGSESAEPFMHNKLDFDATLPESDLVTVLKNEKDRKFLYAPVLSCTIDHLMAATESKRGGRYILPTLRLMSSDLVIDEIDDFDGNDLIAIGRLIHLAGLLGRKVMISSATITPDIAEGYYNAYQNGWRTFAKMRQYSPLIGCAWTDDFSTQVQSINSASNQLGLIEYQKSHQAFIKKRLKALLAQPALRKADMIPCQPPADKDKDQITAYFHALIESAIIEKHRHNHVVDQNTGKKVSFGVVRMANITPCVELTKYLLTTDSLPGDTEIRTMAYHSQQILIMRNAQEQHLDAVLKRKNGEQAAFAEPVIQQHLQDIEADNVIFILVATPVEEVGRDHCFDWAVIEPSSYRSFIQLAGRVLRHRHRPNGIEYPNIGILQYNLRALLDNSHAVFCRPGYESKRNKLDTHDVTELVDANALAKKLDATPRIDKPVTPHPKTQLADLEHECLHQLLTSYDQKGAAHLQGWLTGYWWLTAIPQTYTRFRASSPQLTLFLAQFEDQWKFAEKNWEGKILDRQEHYRIKRDELSTEQSQRLWLSRDYQSLLEEQDEALGKAALIYGEINLPTYNKNLNDLSFTYSSQLGLVAGKEETTG